METILVIVPLALLAAFLFCAVLLGFWVPELALNWRYWTSTGKGRLAAGALVLLLLAAGMKFLMMSCVP